MNPKIKNAIIFISIGALVILVYIFFIKGKDDNGGSNLVSTPLPATSQNTGSTLNSNPAVGGEFLSLLLSVKSLKLDDAIFNTESFKALQDSSITLAPDGTEGRPNPFAPFGQENISNATTTTTPTPPAQITTPPANKKTN